MDAAFAELPELASSDTAFNLAYSIQIFNTRLITCRSTFYHRLSRCKLLVSGAQHILTVLGLFLG
jgi:hypothetical protein